MTSLLNLSEEPLSYSEFDQYSKDEIIKAFMQYMNTVGDCEGVTFVKYMDDNINLEIALKVQEYV
jgi:hypothetical protein